MYSRGYSRYRNNTLLVIIKFLTYNKCLCPCLFNEVSSAVQVMR
jgi:hypothetical protein